jgi:hypothetical protein
MGFDCVACQSAAAQNFICALQGSLFRHLLDSNPAGLKCLEAFFFRAP